MSDGTSPFRVQIKDSATKENTAAEQLANDQEEIIEYPDQSAARQTVDTLNAQGDGQVKIQRVSQNDSKPVDAYLVADPDQHKWQPKGSPGETMEFDITANQYGAIAETIVTADGIPALKHFVYHELGKTLPEQDKEAVRVRRISDQANFDWDTLNGVSETGHLNWTPDCELRVSGRSGFSHQYFCEIKGGDASFERNQMRDMRAVAAVADVLKVRVDLDELPGSYTVRFQRVSPTDS